MKKQTTLQAYTSIARATLVACLMLLFNLQLSAQTHGCSAHYQYGLDSTANKVHFFSAMNSPTTHYSWTFGDGGTSTAKNPDHNYASAGTYYVCLTVVDTTFNGICKDTWCDSIRNFLPPPPPPKCDAHFVWYSSFNSTSVKFDNAPNPYGSTYSWDFGDGKTGTGNDPSHTYTSSGTYYVCLTVSDSTSSGKCTDTKCDSVRITTPPPPPPPVCNAHFNWYPVFNSTTIHFDNAQNPNGSIYSWDFGDGKTGTGNDPSHTYAAGGTYYVCLTVTDSTSSGKCTDTRCDSVHVTTPPPPPPPVCNAHFSWYPVFNSTDIHFTASQNPPGSTYSWDFGDGNTGTGNNPSHTYTTAGTYYVCLTVSDSTSSGKCTDTKCDSVRVLTPPPPPPPHCDAHFHYSGYSSNFFSAANPPGTTYAWSFGDGFFSTSANPKHVYASNGTYYVCLTVKDSTASGKCSDTQCDSVHIGPPPPPPPHHYKHCDPHFRYFPDSVQWTKNFVHAFNSKNTTYSWTFGDGGSSTLPNPSHTYPDSGMYYVCLTVKDSDSVGVCTATHCDSVCVGLKRCMKPHWIHHKLAEEMTAGETISAVIYPNPISESATIHIENTAGTVTFKLYEITGRLAMMKENLSNGDFQFDKKDLNRGVYFYEISDGTNVVQGKLLVQ